MTRIRIMGPDNIVGYAIQGGTIAPNTTSQTTYTLRSECRDEVAAGDGHPFTVLKAQVQGKNHATGISSNSTSSFPRSLDRFSTTFARDPNHASFAHPGIIGQPSDASLATELLAKTNPSRPVVDIPVFIGELGDLPDLVRKAGGGLLRRLASGNLKYQFGIRPLVSDMWAMLNFADHVDKRFRELTALQEKGLRRKRRLWEGSTVVYDNSVVFNSSPNWVAVNGRTQVVSHRQAWGFVKWFPTGGFPTTDRDKLRLARRAVLGLTIDGATAWELIPFSWLIDYFTNVGDYLKATRNIVPCTHTVPQIMKQYSTETRCTVTSDSTGLFAKNWSIVRSTKSRVISPASLSAHFPLLSLRQMSILGSLVILRRRGRY